MKGTIVFLDMLKQLSQEALIHQDRHHPFDFHRLRDRNSHLVYWWLIPFVSVSQVSTRRRLVSSHTISLPAPWWLDDITVVSSTLLNFSVIWLINLRDSDIFNIVRKHLAILVVGVCTTDSHTVERENYPHSFFLGGGRGGGYLWMFSKSIFLNLKKEHQPIIMMYRAKTTPWF